MRKVPLKITFLALSAMFAGSACSGESVPEDGADAAAPAPAAATPAADVADAGDAGDAAPGGPVSGQDLQLVQFGASMYAASEFCKLDYDISTRDAVRDQQKQATVAQGRMSASQFDEVFEAHRAKVKAHFAAMSPEERATNCAPLERIGRPEAG